MSFLSASVLAAALATQHHHPGGHHGSMAGMLGDWKMNTEGSGTSWLPEDSPMWMTHLPKAGRYDLNLMGFATGNYSDSGGQRGDHKFYSNSMVMLMARRETGGGRLGLRAMASLDPIFNGRFGYPNLFQTGETAYGDKLVDFQHPHDLVSELAVSYSHPLGNGVSGFAYLGPVGEPALGPGTFAHRPSGMDIPEAPITHHWIDSTHISAGVATLGLNTRKWQIEGSAFNGHEPDENRYSPDPVSLNSYTGRISFAPDSRSVYSLSHAYLNEPESTEPGVNQHRTVASGMWNVTLGEERDLALTAIWGQNSKGGDSHDAYVLEASLLNGGDTLFARYENVDKDELSGVPAGSYRVQKLLVGGIKRITAGEGYDVGLGAYAGFYSFPSALEPAYGKNPVTLGVFVRVRPGRM